MHKTTSYEPIRLEQPGANGAVTSPGSWRDTLLALLPYLWPIFFLAILELGKVFYLFRWTIIIGAVVLFLGLLAWLIRTVDPDTFPALPLWTASWLGFPLVAAFTTISLVLWNLVPQPQWGEAIAHVVILACLFTLLRWNQRMGLLAALPYLSVYLGWWWQFDAPQALHKISWLGPWLLVGSWLWLGGTAVAIVRLQKSEWAAWLLVALCLVQIAIQQIAAGVSQPYNLLTADTWPHYLTALAPFVLVLLLRPFWTMSQQGSIVAPVGYYLLWAGLLFKMLAFTDLVYLLVEPIGQAMTMLSLEMRVGLACDLAGLLAIALAAWSRRGPAAKIIYPFLALALILAPLPYALGQMVTLAEGLPGLSAPLLHGLGLAWLSLSLVVYQAERTLDVDSATSLYQP